MGIETGACRCIHQQLTGIAWISPFSIYSWAGRYSLQRSSSVALKVTSVEWVRRCSCQNGGNVYNHPVDANISVWCHERGRLRAVDGLMKWPRALSWTLSCRVSHPRVW
eukprot:Gb_03721 [translate_table: standard]